MKILNSVIVLSSLTASSLLAASPNIGDIIKQVEPPKAVIEKKSEPLIEIGGIKKYTPPMEDDKSGKTLFIKSFEIEGSTKIETTYLQSLIESYNNKDLTFSDIKKVASIITKEYRLQGYFVSRAYIPVQNMQDHIVTISVIEGNYGEFKLENNSLVKDSLTQSMLDEAKRNNIVSTDTLERAMLIINDTPGIVVTAADVMPGKNVGTSDFYIKTEESKRFDGYFLADNMGSRYSGKNRLMAGLNINSPLNIGDKLTVSGLISNGEDLKNGGVTYSFPLLSNGLRSKLSYSDTSYSLSKEYESLEAIGNSKTFDITFDYPIKRTRLSNLNVSLNLAKKELKDEVKSTNDTTSKDVKVMNINFAYDKQSETLGFDSNFTSSLTYTLGNLEFKENEKKVSDESGANTNGSYSKIGFTLGKTIAFSEKITLDGMFTYQHSLGNKNLDGSEDISIGGSTGVKVYPDGELSAENGYILNIEAKYSLPNLNRLTSQLGIFYDRGKAYMADNNVGFESKSLQDVGLGYYSNYKDFFAQVQVAWTVNSESVSTEPTANSRVLFQGGLLF